MTNFPNMIANSTRALIQSIQEAIGVPITGQLDALTTAAIRNFQIKAGLNPTGGLDQSTIAGITAKLNINIDMDEDMKDDNTDISTDLSETSAHLEIHEYMLPSDEYITKFGKITDKKYIFIHHTAGWDNPYKTADAWANDTRGQIGTHYVIGGKNVKTGDDKYDGEVLQCIPDEYFGWHLGDVDSFMHKHSIGIELCNFGYLTLGNDGIYRTYTGQAVPKDQVADLGVKFRGYRYWHRYTDKQLSSLKALIEMLSGKYNINIYTGLVEWMDKLGDIEAFQYADAAKHGEVKGLLSHTCVRTDKFDVSPQPKLIEMLRSLVNRSKH